MELPDQPDPGDFIDDRDYVRPAYYDALHAWERICLAIITAPAPAIDAVDPPTDRTGHPSTRA